MIGRDTIVKLGGAQLVSWGVTFYLVGPFGSAMASDFGWPDGVVYGGLSAALVVMGLSAPVVGALIDRFGGRFVMASGALFNAAGCGGIALSQGVVSYYAAWLCLGLGMQLTLFDAAFATLAKLGGAGARRAMAQITLLGGLASSTFWPLGGLLLEHLGWRGAVLVFAACALATLPVFLSLPRAPATSPAPCPPAALPAGLAGRQRAAAGLHLTIMTVGAFLNVGMASHMIAILTGLGLAFSAAVWIGTLRGIGQSAARLGEVLFGRSVHPLALNGFACALLPVAFAIGLFSGHHPAAGMAFAFLYGAGNGLLTITRGTVPLVLFDTAAYGTIMGRLVAPSFLVSATAPLAYALAIARFGEMGALGLSLLLSLLAVAAAAFLLARQRRAA
ncbi:MAG: MFS transporter [Pseudomonadota bacterium]